MLRLDSYERGGLISSLLCLNGFQEREHLSVGYSGTCFFCICISTQGHREQLESSYFVLFK